MRKLAPRSLRARLILSFGLLIFVSLFLAGTTTVYLLKQQQERTAREKIGRLAGTVGLRASFLEASGATPQQIVTTLEQEYDARILLLDRQSTVVSDTGNTLVGASLEEFSFNQAPGTQRDTPPLAGQSGGNTSQPGPRALSFQVTKFHQGSNDFLLFVAPQSRLRVAGGGVFLPSYQAVVAVKASDVQQAWRELLPRLFLAGSLAFLVGVFAAGLLARGITQPLREMTIASEEMARGRYDQQLPIHGGEEVQRVGQAFNAMASQVSHSHRTLRDFLANVSHELKTPLTSIQGFSQALTDGSITRPEDAADAGRIINDEAIRMRGLVDDLLYLSQVEAGEFVMQFDRISPSELLQATRERFQRRADQTLVQLDLQNNLTPPVQADARRLEQALANLVDNALRHTPSGGRVTLRSTADDGQVRLAVHNTGSYIPPASLARIFERFYQATPDRARANGNTGLGLAITKEIVEAHGGTINVTSAPEAGTEFTITLPADRT